MRIAYENIIDTVTTTSIVASSEASGYEVANVQDTRLSTRWISDTATAQTVVVELDTFPEFPDYATGTSYIQGDDTADTWTGWSGTNCSIAVSSGNITMTATANAAYSMAITSALGTSLTTKAKIKVSAAGTYQIRGTVAGVANTTIVEVVLTAGQTYILNGSFTGALTALLVRCTSGLIGDTILVDWIYVGDGTYSTLLSDESGNANHATVYGATPVDGWLSFDGINDYANISLNGSSTSYSLSAKLKLNAGSVVQDLMYLMGSPFAILLFRVDASNRLLALWTDTTGTGRTLNGPILVVGTEYHITVIHNGTEVFIYVNGVLNTSTTTNASLTNSTKVRLRIFANGNTLANYSNALLKKPLIYNRALSAAEILSLYNEESFNTESHGLAGYWPLNYGLGVNTAAIMGHNILSGTQVKIEANDSNAWDDPELSETMTANSEAILKFFTSTYTYKYWRFTFTGQASVQVGRLWLGEYLTIDPASLLDFNVEVKRNDTVVYGRGRQKYASPGVTWRRISLSFPKTKNPMLIDVINFVNTVGQHTSFIFCNFDTIRDYPLVEPMYCSLNNDIAFRHTNRQVYTYTLNMEEDK